MLELDFLTGTSAVQRASHMCEQALGRNVQTPSGVKYVGGFLKNRKQLLLRVAGVAMSKIRCQRPI